MSDNNDDISDSDFEFDEDLLDDDLLDEAMIDDDFSFDEPFAGDIPQEAQVSSDGLQEPKKKFSLNFNTAIILGGVVLGVSVLLLNVFKAQKEVTTNVEPRFVSSLGIEGATETMGVNDTPQEGQSVAQADVKVPIGNFDQMQEARILEQEKEQAALKDGPTVGGFLNDDFDALPGADKPNLIQDDINLPMPTPMIDEDFEFKSVADDLVFMTEAQKAKEEIVIQSPDGVEIQTNTNVVSPSPTSIIEPQENLVFDEPVPVVSEVTEFVVDEIETISGEEVPDVVSVVQELGQAQPEIIEVQDIVEPDIIEISDISTQIVESAPVSIDVSSIENKLDGFIGRIDALENKIDQYDSQSRKREETIKSSIRDLENRIGRKPVQKAKAPVSQMVRKAKSARSNVSSWELKAAQPGKAWIVKKGSNKIEPINVGDRIEGLGRIQAISMQGSKWVVKGTQKTIFN